MYWNAKRVVRGRAHDTQTLTAFKYAHDTRGMCFGNSVSGNSSEIRDCVRGEKMPYELQGGERRRKAFEKKSGDFSPKSSNKAQGVEAERNYRHERHFRRKAFLNAKGFKKLHFCHVRKGMGRGTQRA